MKLLIRRGDCLTCFSAFSSILANQVLEKYFGCRVAEPAEIENARDSGLDFKYSVVDLGLLLCHSSGPNKYFIKTLEPWIKMDFPVVLPYHCLSAARLKRAPYEIQIELKNSDRVISAPVFKILREGLSFSESDAFGFPLQESIGNGYRRLSNTNKGITRLCLRDGKDIFTEERLNFGSILHKLLIVEN